MREALKKLNTNPGIKGSMILTRDGIVVASELSLELDEDTTAALVGNVVTQTTRLLAIGRFAPMERMTLTATRGKIVIENCDNCLLVVVTNQFINLDLTVLEIAGAAKMIRKLGKIAV